MEFFLKKYHNFASLYHKKHKNNKMKNVLLALVCLATLSVSAQEEKKWVISVGVNFIDNTNSEDNNYLDVSNWNSTLSVSKLGVQYYFDEAFSLGSEFSLNRLDRDIRQNGGNIDANKIYFALDLNARYDVASLLKFPSKFSVEPLVGFGTNWTDSIPNQSLNAGMTIGYQIDATYGIRVQTVGKFAAENNTLGNNMIQHSIEFLIKL